MSGKIITKKIFCCLSSTMKSVVCFPPMVARRPLPPKSTAFGSVYSVEWTLEFCSVLSIRSWIEPHKASSLTWHWDCWPIDWVGKECLNNSCLTPANAGHSETKCIGHLIASSSRQSRHKSTLLSLAIERCFLHHPWPEKNWILMPRCFLDIWS